MSRRDTLKSWIENEVITMLNSTSSGLFDSYMGGWLQSWKTEVK